MARIRSIHPGLFTDERFMELTVRAPLAVTVLVGLWTEADDNGAFEWKPIQLKARTIPAVAIPIEPLLDVLVELDFIRLFQIGGRKLGAVRNFKRYQRPKKPKTVHVTSAELLQYVSSGGDSSEPDHASDDDGGELEEPEAPLSGELDALEAPPNSAKGRTRPAEGGGRRKDVGGKGSTNPPQPPSPAAARPDPEPTSPAVSEGDVRTPAEIVFQAKPDVKALAAELNDWLIPLLNNPKPMAIFPIIQWLEAGASADLIKAIVSDVVTRKRQTDKTWTPGSLSYFQRVILQAIRDGTVAPTQSPADQAGELERKRAKVIAGGTYMASVSAEDIRGMIAKSLLTAEQAATAGYRI